MTTALTARNKIAFIDGTLPRPDSGHLLYNAWIRYNSMVTSWILNSVSKEIVDSLLYIETVSKIWQDLRDRFHQSNGPRIFQIKKHPIALNQGAMGVNSYFTRLKILWDEYKDFQPLPPCQKFLHWQCKKKDNVLLPMEFLLFPKLLLWPMQFLHQLNKGVRSLFVHIVVSRGTQFTNAIKYMVIPQEQFECSSKSSRSCCFYLFTISESNSISGPTIDCSSELSASCKRLSLLKLCGLLLLFPVFMVYQPCHLFLIHINFLILAGCQIWVTHITSLALQKLLFPLLPLQILLSCFLMVILFLSVVLVQCHSHLTSFLTMSYLFLNFNSTLFQLAHLHKATNILLIFSIILALFRTLLEEYWEGQTRREPLFLVVSN